MMPIAFTSRTAWLPRLLLTACCTVTPFSIIHAADVAQAPWMADLGNGQYQNPILYADYSDPDVTRVGDDYYMVSSSFTNTPGLPILHSKDLVNWSLISHALPKQTPVAHHTTPRRGGGVWAPAIRYHNGLFMVYYPDPDFGIFVVTAQNPAGPWSEPVLVDGSRGVIDPAPFWDTDGNAYLVMAYAKSRAGINNVLTLKRMNQEGTQVIGEGQTIINGDKLPAVDTSTGKRAWVTIEGSKLYQRNGYYYVFAPAGSVKPGWQGVFRAKNIWGPYEARNVMDQGQSPINGPHQGAWVTTQTGEDWFLHFQDRDSFGRVVHLQPLQWKDNWPVIGSDPGNSGRGEPVLTYKKPNVGKTYPVAVPEMDDEFNGKLSLAWQWNANPQDDWMNLAAVPGILRLKSISASANLYEAGHLLTQKIPGPNFTVTTKLKFTPKADGEQAGLVMFGYDYGWIGLKKVGKNLRLVQNLRIDAKGGMPEKEMAGLAVQTDTVYLRLSGTQAEVKVVPPNPVEPWPAELRAYHAKVRFSYSLDGQNFMPFGEEMLTQPGRWVGAQFGLFGLAPSGTPSNVATEVGYADFDWFHVTR